MNAIVFKSNSYDFKIFIITAAIFWLFFRQVFYTSSPIDDFLSLKHYAGNYNFFSINKYIDSIKSINLIDCPKCRSLNLNTNNYLIHGYKSLIKSKKIYF